jgi:hypothetical protein
VWSSMSTSAQERAIALAKARKSLAKVPLLMDMRAKLSVEEGKKLGVEVVHEVEGRVRVAAFDVPGLYSRITNAPKGT